MKKLVAAGAVIALVGVAGPAYAHTDSSGAHKNKPSATLSPSKGVKTGAAIHVNGTHGLKNTGYSCIQVILHHNVAGEGTSNLQTIVGTHSNKKGAFKCTEVFHPFNGVEGTSTAVHCPPTKAEAKHGYSCAVAFFDTATAGKKSAGFTKFTAK